MTVKIYHNPRCSKSRQAVALLTEKGIAFETVLYLVNVPSTREIKDLLIMLNMPARKVMRKKEAEFQALGLANGDLSEETLIAAIVKNPKLLERPIVVNNGKAAIGRPLENILDIL